MIELHQGDCLDVMHGMAENSVDAIVTDPPYGLTNNGGGPHSKGLGNAFARARAGATTGGFMGMKWDSGVPSVEIWTECLRVLKPGGYMLAFAGTRTQHRMATNIEDSGFEIRDMIAWVYGSGFPKSHNGEWGGTALKPALEPITVARKPLAGTVEANWFEHGTGALNIDGCRIEAGAEVRGPVTGKGGMPARHTVDAPRDAGVVSQPHDLGRWPANLIHDGSDEVLAAFPNAPGQMADVKFGSDESKTGNVYGRMTRGNEPSADMENGGIVGFKMRPGVRRADAGNAARFFYCAKADRSDRNDGCEDLQRKPLNWSSGTQSPGTFQAEGTDRSSPNNHPTVKPTDLMRYLCRLVTPAGGLILDPFMGSGSTGRGAVLEGFRFVGIEREADYMEIARLRIDSARRQGHQPSLDLEAA